MTTHKFNPINLYAIIFGLLSILISGCIRRPEPGSITNEIGKVCFFQRLGEPWHVQVRTEGCYSTRCTRQVQKTGKLLIDQENRSIHFEASWVLSETSGFPFGCSDDCMGGGTLDFYLDEIEVGDWTVFFGDDEIGSVIIPSGRLIEHQCFSP